MGERCVPSLIAHPRYNSRQVRVVKSSTNNNSLPESVLSSTVYRVHNVVAV